MDFLNLLIPKEKIVGIEIGNRKLRMLALAKDSFGNISVQGKSEVDMEEGVIDHGAVKDGKKLSAALASLKKTFKPRSALSVFAIVTVSQNNIYSDILEFPKNLTNEQLIEAISFNVAKSSPLPLSECYLDWQLIETGKVKDKILTYIIPKGIVNAYKSALEENGFSLIALESTTLSIGRAAEITGEPTLFFYLTDEGVTSMIYSGNNSYFSQFEFWQEASGGAPIKDIGDLSKVLKTKIKNLSYYFENQYNKEKIKKVLLMSEGFDADKIIGKIDYKDVLIEKASSGISSIDNYDWIPVGGAAKRAFIPRSEDTIISLLPVGTESLYETQKMTSFANSILIVVATIMLFYIVAFTTSLFFISYLGKDLSRQMETRSNMQMPADYSKIDQETKEFNGYVSDLLNVSSKTSTDYGAIMGKISSLNSSGIALTSISFDNISGVIAISGVSSSREDLNAFKFRLANSSFFSNVKFSVQNIAQKSNIPFSTSFNLK
ncbi:MAG: pilus assembly protein PilM [bacterium]|nr:pilus assembly protein PilM [bacterium]